MKKIVKGILIIVVVGLLGSVVKADSKADTLSGDLVIFHAGSLAVPFKAICKQFNKAHPSLNIFREAAGSRMCARKISDLGRACDVMASADYTVIDTLLIPEYATWNIRFASNEMVIAYRADSHRAEKINKDNWFDILLQKDVAFGRSDPNADPCGYRSILMMKLAEKYYGRDGILEKMLAKDGRYVRPKEVDLLMLLEIGEIDYIFIYRSVAQQHGLKIMTLPDEINLKKKEYDLFYKTVSLRLTGKRLRTFVTKRGGPIVYGVTMPVNAVNRQAGLAFLEFLLDADKGGAILEGNGQSFIVPAAATENFDKIPERLKRFAIPIGKDKGEGTAKDKN